MRISILSLFPEALEPYISASIPGRAQEKGLVRFELINPREFTNDKHRRVDDAPYGGGAGMVLQADPFYRAWESVRSEGTVTVVLDPVGHVFTQSLAEKFAVSPHLVLMCGHYEGFDARIYDEVGAERVSLGDFVVTGGELPALIVADAVIRLVDGVLGNAESAVKESFQDGLLEHDHYTRPRNWRGMEIPDVLLSGHHARQEDHRHLERLYNTWRFRPDLLRKRGLSKAEASKLLGRIEEELTEITQCTDSETKQN